MDWKLRLQALTLAGGTLLAGGCPRDNIPVCNANRDPCCNDPNPVRPKECAEKKACEAKGGRWDYPGCAGLDAGPGSD